MKPCMRRTTVRQAAALALIGVFLSVSVNAQEALPADPLDAEAIPPDPYGAAEAARAERAAARRDRAYREELQREIIRDERYRERRRAACDETLYRSGISAGAEIVYEAQDYQGHGTIRSIDRERCLVVIGLGEDERAILIEQIVTVIDPIWRR